MSLRSTIGFIWNHPLNQGDRPAAIRRFLRWQLSSRILPYASVVPFVDRISMLLSRRRTGLTGNYYCGLHEYQDMAFVLHLIRPGDVFYDVGANAGSYSLLAAAAGATTVHAFEPSSGTADVLEQNIGLNLLSDRVLVHRCALGEAPGSVRFTMGGDTTNHVAAASDSQEHEEVPVGTLDSFHEPGVPSFVKIDVEGYEEFVLKGARSLLQDPALMGVLVESDGCSKRYGPRWDPMKTMSEFGFFPWTYSPAARLLTEGRIDRSLSQNVLFLRDVEFVRSRIRNAAQFRLVNGNV